MLPCKRVGIRNGAFSTHYTRVHAYMLRLAKMKQMTAQFNLFPQPLDYTLGSCSGKKAPPAELMDMIGKSNRVTLTVRLVNIVRGPDMQTVLQ